MCSISLPLSSTCLLCPGLGEMALYVMAGNAFLGGYMAGVRLEPSQVAVSLTRNADFIKGWQSQDTPVLLSLLQLLRERRGALRRPPRLCASFPCCRGQGMHPEEQSSWSCRCAKLSTVTEPSQGLNALLQ